LLWLNGYVVNCNGDSPAITIACTGLQMLLDSFG
jgi:hypothetical protein